MTDAKDQPTSGPADGPGSVAQPESRRGPQRRAPSRRDLLVGALAGAAGLAGGLAIGGKDAAGHGDAGGDSARPSAADIGFCTDMSAHHVQALVMCQRVLGRDTGGAVQAAAAEVLQNQAIELGQMRAWLADWGESTGPSEVAMAWMHGDHGSGDHGAGVPTASMPGMATPAQLDELSTLAGRAKGRRWLELMRAHHVGGVAMGQAAAELAALAKVRQLAASMAAVQTFEIEQYDLLLAGPYA